MGTLQERLNRIREGFTAEAPAEVLETMHRATEAIRATGIMDRIPRVGDALPAFSLADTEGTAVSSTDLLARGPLIITFYRGVW